MDTLTEQAALRVAMAVKSLPNVNVRSLLGLLIQHLGEPLSEEKLMGLSAQAFHLMINSLGGDASRKDITSALNTLTDPSLSQVGVPTVKVTQPLAGPKLRVALTSNQGEMINGHYGSCMRVLIYEVNDFAYQLVDVRPIDAGLKGEDRALFLLSKIKDCQILFTLSIGGPAAARVTRANIHPIKRAVPQSADDALTELSTVIRQSPPPWLQKCMGIYHPKNLVDADVA
ncbi:dinitrogenase iron-molybdenum cofactor [Vibrio sp. CAIM 722]|uniref:Dinitrogenase iron-molybdenum cofactor n=1 Tax=Vibrio eleionomae TaxID=2653505 RepID=A0A7X4RU85_9VIBR|nr:NifB/NifX family molybdenum-iron cluster-binding protein [Vibrio eleionomae]MZI93025.1 dinitrogenase iron-molybdenum cofactor [Vibrio eleionomae]